MKCSPFRKTGDETSDGEVTAILDMQIEARGFNHRRRKHYTW